MDAIVLLKQDHKTVAALFKKFERVRRHQFDYELNVLLYATSAGATIEESTIPTIYPPGNSSSHFHALADSARIYWAMARFAATRTHGDIPAK